LALSSSTVRSTRAFLHLEVILAQLFAALLSWISIQIRPFFRQSSLSSNVGMLSALKASQVLFNTNFAKHLMSRDLRITPCLVLVCLTISQILEPLLKG